MQSTMTTHPHRRRSHSRAARLRQTLQQQDDQEIDRIAAEFHARLPRDQAQGIAALYARYSSDHQDSIVDQVRSLFEAALALRLFVPREFVCFDHAVRGAKQRRPGLDQLRSILARRDISVLLVFSTNRLFRKTYKALQFVEEEVVERGIRCRFLNSHLDTADQKGWRMLLNFHAMTDEFAVGMYADNIRAAHEGLLDNRRVCYTIAFGYRGGEIPHETNPRQRSRRLLEIDQQAAQWVQKAFQWYVEDRLPIDEIVRRFNADPTIPPSPRSGNGPWTHQAIRHLLANPRYRGWWEYGAKENQWQSSKDYVRRVAREQPLRGIQFEDLRLVSDELWYQAQRRLAQAERATVGRKPKRTDLGTGGKLIHALFVCPNHDQILYVGGSYGQLLSCKKCRGLPAQMRPLYSELNRKLAVKLTCQTLADLIRQDADLVHSVMEACRQEAARLQQPDPSRLQDLRAESEKLKRQIEFIMKHAGDTDTDREESISMLTQSRLQRADLQSQIKTLEAVLARPPVVPTEAQVRQLLDDFHTILSSAGTHGNAEEQARVRQVIDLLTGGRIELVQRGDARAKRGWLQGQFHLRLIAGSVEKLAGTAASEDSQGPLITIDFREPTPSETLAPAVKALYDQGKLITDIAVELGISRNLAAKALDCWYQQRGLSRPDGRSRRATLEEKHRQPPRYMQLAPEALRLYQAGHTQDQIAAQLDSCRPTIAKALKYASSAQGLSVPAGRRRDQERNPDASQMEPECGNPGNPPPSAA
jgi:predicted site-specific integrase-resolvase